MSVIGEVSKKRKLEDEEESMIEKEEYENVLKHLKELSECQNQLDELNDQASEEILKVEEKYKNLTKPLLENRRNSLMNIKNFWGTALSNHPQIFPILDSEAEECLYFLTQLEVEEFEDMKSGYRIKFYFEENPFFENDVIVKEFYLEASGEPGSVTTPIKWKKVKDSMNGLKGSPEVNGDELNHDKPITFITWLSDDVKSAADDIAEAIKEDIWPNPLQYFLDPVVEQVYGSGEAEIDNEDVNYSGDETEDGMEGEDEIQTVEEIEADDEYSLESVNVDENSVTNGDIAKTVKAVPLVDYDELSLSSTSTM